METARTVIFVEGESDRIALEVLGVRLGMSLPSVVTVGGSKGVRRAVAEFRDSRVVGLVDAAERRDFDAVMEQVFVCDPDLEGEFIRALGVAGVEDVIAAQGELESFRRLQNQPAQRERTPFDQLERFFGGRSGNKHRYARLLATAVPLDHLPPPIAGLLAAATAPE